MKINQHKYYYQNNFRSHYEFSLLTGYNNRVIMHNKIIQYYRSIFA